MFATSLSAWLGFRIGLADAFVLTPPLGRPPWEFVTSVYAHSSLSHLASNAVVVLLAGSLVALSTTALRFHAFFLTSGALAGTAQVALNSVVGGPVAVLGASGAAFALVGYLVTGNPATTALVDRVGVSTRAVAGLVAVVALLLTLTYSAPGSALVAHLVGAVCGLVAGRFSLLRAD
jgi:membrane associated rhomboid family serine protease